METFEALALGSAVIKFIAAWNIALPSIYARLAFEDQRFLEFQLFRPRTLGQRVRLFFFTLGLWPSSMAIGEPLRKGIIRAGLRRYRGQVGGDDVFITGLLLLFVGLALDIVSAVMQ